MKAMVVRRFLPDKKGVFQLLKDCMISMQISSEIISHPQTAVGVL